jgi:ATP-dependent DNA helicase RecQ
MRNQLAAAERMGVRAATINSDNRAEWTKVEAKLARGDLNRSSLSLQTTRLPSQAERLACLAEQLATLQGHGII